jgi:CheY-like chemotaxis protein
MLSFSYDRVHRVVRLDFADLFTSEDLNSIDPLLIELLGRESQPETIRVLYNMTAVKALAVSQPLFAQRAARPAIGDVERVVAAPPWATIANFGSSYRAAQSLFRHPQPTIVPTLADAVGMLSLVNFRPRILLVEDEALLAKLFEETLNDAGFDVVAIGATLEDALSLAGSLPLDAAVLDVNLQGQASFPVAELLRRRGIPCMFCTAYSKASMPLHVRHLPMVEKPFLPQTLIAILRRIVKTADNA